MVQVTTEEEGAGVRALDINLVMSDGVPDSVLMSVSGSLSVCLSEGVREGRSRILGLLTLLTLVNALLCSGS